MTKYSYLLDFEFLKALDINNLKTLYARINILNINDQPIAAIEGQAIGGSINVNGKSSVRRTGTLQMVADEQLYKITDIKNLIAIDKRIEIEIGVENSLKQKYYSNHDIIWFPLGIFIITNASITHNKSGVNISLNLKDKMVLLNGEKGGKLTSPITHSPAFELDANGNEVSIPVRFRDLIYTLVSEYGGIPKDRILIDDIDLRIKSLLRWGSDRVVYLLEGQGENNLQYSLTTSKPNGEYTEYHFNDNIGYAFTDFTYPTGSELNSNAGETITSVLDKIKNTLGNYEYFFDLDGIFHFQMIKNYINEGSALSDITEALNDKYFTQASAGQSIYEFSDGRLISSYSNAPKYSQIKNDIVVWGQLPDTKIGIRYHVAIDTPPKDFNSYWVKFYEDKNGIIRAQDVKTEETLGYEEIVPKDWRSELYFNYLAGKENNLKYYSKELEEEWPKLYNIKTDTWRNINYNTMTYFFDMIDPEELKDEKIKSFSIDSIGKNEHVINDSSINCLFSFLPNDVCFIEAGRGQETEAERNECQQKGQPYVQVSSGIMKSMFIGTAQNSAFDLVRSVLRDITGYNETINLTVNPIYYLEPNSVISVQDKESDIYGEYMINSLSIPLALNGNMTINATRVIEQI